jgi:LysM repeat protein
VLKRLGMTILVALTFTLLVSMGSAAAAPNEGGLIHVVRYGETLSGIAVRYGVNMWSLARANNIANPSRIYVGQRLFIPRGGPGTTWQGGAVHIVQRGETLSGIAARYGVNMWALAHANHIANPSRIYAGQRLVIAAGYPAPHWGGGGVIHVVQRGQTLSGIACRYGVSVWAIANANGICNPNIIYAGQRLVIP